MRIAMITTPTRCRLPNSTLPLGVAMLSAYMERLGHEVVIFDAARYRWPRERLTALVAAFNPDLIGISAIVTAYAYVIAVSHAFKAALPHVPLVLGGHLTINNDVNCFRHMAVDYLVHGYGEIALEKLVEHLSGNYPVEGIPGLSYRYGDSYRANPGREYVADINSLPFPAYHLLDFDYYASISSDAYLLPYLAKTGKTVKNTKLGGVLLALGCTGRCTFCVHEQEYVGIKYFNMDYVERHIRHLHDVYDIHVLGIGEEMAFSSPQRVHNFCQLMNDKFPDIFWAPVTRAKYLDREMMEAFEKSNCYVLRFGFESGSTRILKTMHKGVTAEENIRAAQIGSGTHITQAVTLMVGNVGETNESISETVEAIRKSNLGVTTGLFFTTPYPGGRVWDWCVEQGIIKDVHEYLLQVSNQDASVFRVNLTPYPDWVVRLWCEQVWRAIQGTERSTETLALRAETAPSPLAVWKEKKSLAIRMAAADVVEWLLDFRRRKLRWTLDRRYEYATDRLGVLLPRNLILGSPQGTTAGSPPPEG